MTDIIRIGLDTSKSLFQLHGVNAAEQPVLRKQLRRAEMILASVHMRAHQQAAHMHASDPIKISAYASCKREPSTYAISELPPIAEISAAGHPSLMKRVATYASVVALCVASSALAEGPYVRGRLTHPAYGEIAGTPAELAEMKTYAAAHGWAVVCDQRVGALSTMRLRFPVGTSQEAIEGYFVGNCPPGRGSKFNMIYYGMPTTSPGCILLP